ncbi:unnamed protein product [Symbiodinium pilosum]|uniref:peptide-methionine (S)-S-oxide reductase n=1 Tax=Symbiodinium pilosum TaxID=2952 RepID=A0A812T594_SYMPI|nr:unnamed protein product [Symbiodinium pilosum]
MIARALTAFVLLPGGLAWTASRQPLSETVAPSHEVSYGASQETKASQLRGFDERLNVADEESSVMPSWARAGLAALAMVAAVAFAPRAALAESNVNMYVGQGCFWHVQHELVKQETADLGRKAADITALSGYAGGTEVGSKGEVCYHNMAMAPDYGRMGHTEVVNVSVPEGKVGDFAKAYFDAASKYPFGRADPQDRGTEYRSAIGIPGGMDGPLFKEVEAANNGRLQLVRGQGNDADTVGTKKVWIYDSNQFPFHQGEIYHQFHDDMLERYSQEYHQLKKVLYSAGTLQKVACPERR